MSHKIKVIKRRSYGFRDMLSQDFPGTRIYPCDERGLSMKTPKEPSGLKRIDPVAKIILFFQNALRIFAMKNMQNLGKEQYGFLSRLRFKSYVCCQPTLHFPRLHSVWRSTECSGWSCAT